MSVKTASAQRISVVDSEGNGVPYAYVMTTDATFIGTTDMDGVIADVKGVKTVVITHVAYKPVTVNVSSEGQKVSLEDADFGIPEITITKKNYTYLQVYYRIVGVRDDGVLFYRAGIVDNFYNEEKDKQMSSKQHITKAKNATMKMGANIVLSFIVDNKATIRVKPMEEEWMETYKRQGLRIENDGIGRRRIIVNYGELGNITDQIGQRRMSMDLYLANLHQLEAEGKTKELEKQKKQDAKMGIPIGNSYCVYSIDENGHYNPEDFLMEQHMFSSDSEKYGHCVFIMDFFATDRGYLSKEEMKQTKKDNKVKMTYDYLQQFEKLNNIPALPSEILTKVNKLLDE